MKSENVGGSYDDGDAIQSVDESMEEVSSDNMGNSQFRREICVALVDIQKTIEKTREGDKFLVRGKF